MKTAYMATYAVLCLFAISLLVYFIPEYCPESLDGEGVSSALLPQVLAWIILLLSAFLFVMECMKNYAPAQKSPIRAGNWIFLGKYAASFVLVIIAFLKLGYIAGGIICLCLFQFLAGQKRPVVFVSMAVCLPLLFYAGITFGLKAPLP